MSPHAAILLAFVVALTGCDPLSPGEHRTVQRWLLCGECVRGERDSVVAIGDRATRVLGRALNGPPESGRAIIRRQAQAMYERFLSPPLTQQEYMGHFESNYVATYQSRAAVALGLIGSRRARSLLLDAALNDTTLREDVLRAIGAAAPVTVTPVDSTPQSAPADSVVRISPAVLVSDVRDSAAPRPLEGVRVTFRIASGGGRLLTDSVQFTRGSGLATVGWQLGPGIDSVNVLRATAAGRTVRFRATGRGLGPRLTFVVQPSTIQRGDTIATAVRVAVLDAWGQRDSAFTGNMELTVVGAGVAWTNPIVSGEAAFPGLSFTFTGVGQRLLARVTGATEAISAPFDILP